jgi:hypothetical protein
MTPDSPTLTAIAAVSAFISQAAGDRRVPLLAQMGRDSIGADLAGDHVVVVGRRVDLPVLRQIKLNGITVEDSGFRLGNGEAVPADAGVIALVPSPVSPERAMLVITGETEAALAKATLAATTPAGRDALRGPYAIVYQVDPAATGDSLAPLRTTTFRSLGYVDALQSGAGDHSINLRAEIPPLTTDSAVAFDVQLSYSPLIDPSRSSIRLVINGAPVSSVAFRSISPATRGHWRFEVPASALRAGANAVRFDATLNLPAFDGTYCASYPSEQAWFTIHETSGLSTPAPAEGTGGISLASFPYPYLAGGSADGLLLVVPSSLTSLDDLLALTSTIGKLTGPGRGKPTVLRESSFSPEVIGGANVIAVGEPSELSLYQSLQGRLPIGLDGNQRHILSGEMEVEVGDAQDLGVLQEIASPWAAGARLLLVSGNSKPGVALALSALAQGNLTGNLALIGQREPSPDPVATPRPLPVAGPLPPLLEVSSYTVRPTIAPPTAPARSPLPIAAFAILGLGVLVAGAAAYSAWGRRVVQGRQS